MQNILPENVAKSQFCYKKIAKVTIKRKIKYLISRIGYWRRRVRRIVTMTERPSSTE